MQPDVTDAQVGIGIGVCRQCEYQADAKSRAHAFFENNPKSCARSIAFYALVEEISRADNHLERRSSLLLSVSADETPIIHWRTLTCSAVFLVGRMAALT